MSTDARVVGARSLSPMVEDVDRVAGFYAALGLKVTPPPSGLAPALSASQVDLAETIKTGSQRTSSGVWTRVRSLIVAGEVAMTLVLLVSAGLLLRSLYKLSDTNPGFDPAHIVTVRISPNQSACGQRETCIALYDRLLASTNRIPSVQAAARRIADPGG